MQTNPFPYGNAVSPENFIGRNKELRRVTSRLMNGESTAIVGDPRIGRTSFVNYLVNQKTRKELYSDMANQWCFSSMDVKTLGTHFTSAQFWEQVLSPMKELIENAQTDSLLYNHYKVCHENQFGNFTLERLFSQLKKSNRRLILALDGFDNLLYHPILNNAEFYGGLRALASRSEGVFSLIITSRIPLYQMNIITQSFGSPFFNFFAEITLGQFSDNDIKKLFSLANDRFTAHDKQVIRTLAGRHPYLLHVASAAMWDAYEIEKLILPEERQHYVLKRLHQEVVFFFKDSWKTWKPEVRKTFTTVAISHQTRLLNKKGFFKKLFFKGIADWKPELRELEEKGLIVSNKEFEGGYCVDSQIMLIWLEDELIEIGRDQQSFDSWLQDKGIEGGFLSINEKKVFTKTVTDWIKTVSQPATTITAAILQEMTKSL